MRGTEPAAPLMRRQAKFTKDTTQRHKPKIKGQGRRMKSTQINQSNQHSRQGQHDKPKGTSNKHTANSRAGIPMPTAVPLAGWEG